MRRYSLTYFIGQSVQGLWRNGVMSSASILVLMSCLIVMGSFAALVLNINYNLERLGMLNEIVVYVDTELSSGVSSESTDSEDLESVTQSSENTSDIVLDTATAEQTGIYSLESEVENFDNMIDLSTAYAEIPALTLKLENFQLSLDNISDPEERAREQLYFNKIKADFDAAVKRITSLNEIDLKIRALDNVVSVVFTSRAAALAQMKEKFADYSSLFENISRNKLPDKYTITYNDNSKISTLEFNLNHLDDSIYSVMCRSDIAETMENIKHGVVLIFTWFMAILFIVSLFVIINTIKLAVFARRQEISIMRYVGATNWFIVLPFIFEGITIGIIASGLAYLCEYYIYTYVQNFIITSSFYNLILVVQFTDIQRLMLIGFIGIGMFTGIIGSSVSLRKYLKA